MTPCPARRHDTALAYQVDRCRCPAALRDQGRYRKRLRHRHACGATPKVDATGTIRRIAALQAVGWPRHTILAHAGYKDSHWLRPGVTTVHRTTARRFAAVFDELAARPGPSKWTRTWARNQGYAPPFAWDDIDDPNSQPVGVRDPATHEAVNARMLTGVTDGIVDECAVDIACAGRRPVALTHLERCVAVRRLVAVCEDDAEVARRMFMSRDAVTAFRLRAGIPPCRPANRSQPAA